MDNGAAVASVEPCSSSPTWSFEPSLRGSKASREAGKLPIQRTTPRFLSNSSRGKPLPSAAGGGLSLLLQHLITMRSWLLVQSSVPSLAASIPWQPQVQSFRQTGTAACILIALYFVSCPAYTICPLSKCESFLSSEYWMTDAKVQNLIENQSELY